MDSLPAVGDVGSVVPRGPAVNGRELGGDRSAIVSGAASIPSPAARPRTIGARRTGATSAPSRHHQLARDPVMLHVVVSGRDLVHRVDPGDRYGRLAGGDRVQELLEDGL